MVASIGLEFDYAEAGVVQRCHEYRHNADRLADHLPWAALVAPGIVLNKDGSFQRTLSYRGPDLESATESELISASARANNVLKRFGSGWAVVIEAERRPAIGYPDSAFGDAASALVDAERKADFEGGRAHFESRYCMLDALNHQDFAYRWVTRFIALDKTEATKALTRLRRQWFNKRKSVTALLREVMYNQPAALLDSDADNKVVDSDQALQSLGGDHVAFGYLTATITVMGADRAAAEEKVRAVERIVNGLGFTCIRESVNAVEAWLGSLPGHVYANVRQPLVHTLNLAHLMPLSSVWAGPVGNAHLNGPPLLYAETSGSS